MTGKPRRVPRAKNMNTHFDAPVPINNFPLWQSRGAHIMMPALFRMQEKGFSVAAPGNRKGDPGFQPNAKSFPSPYLSPTTLSVCTLFLKGISNFPDWKVLSLRLQSIPSRSVYEGSAPLRSRKIDEDSTAGTDSRKALDTFQERWN